MPEGTTSRTYARRIGGTLLVAAVGIVLLGVGARRPASEESVAMLPVARPIRLDATAGPTRVFPSGSVASSRRGADGAMAWHGRDDDQPAGACWLASVGGALPSCVCAAGTIEDLLTPDYMRTLLMAWRDGGLLTTSELKGRLQEVDAACVRREAAP